MTTSYRTVYFRPRLALDWRVPVAALLSVGGATEAVTAPLLPDHRCLGGIGASELLRFGIAELATVQEDSLPSSLGPHFEIGPRADVPHGLEDPVGWVRRIALPRIEQIGSDETTAGTEKRISTIAWKHLSNWGVSGYVHRRFRPGSAPELHRLPPKVGVVTHFVPGKETILLMEPIAISSTNIHDRIAKVYSKFSAYAKAWDSSEGRQHKLLAYVLPDPQNKQLLDDIERQLHVVANVYNTAVTESRNLFTKEIRRVGDSGPKPELVS